MHISPFKKIYTALYSLVTAPARSLSWIRRGALLTDRVVIDQSYWFLGKLKHEALQILVPNTATTDITIPRAYDRTFGTSVTVTEAAAVASLVKSSGAKRVLEIGTFDGNTTLLIAANLCPEGKVITVDLPPDFNPSTDQASLGHRDVKINLTPRDQVAGQYQKHPLATKITQIYGDSATLDWSTFGGPFDIIFIDGCHKEAYVRSDSEKAFAQLALNGMIIWHDYGVIPDVSYVVDIFAQEHTDMSMSVIEGTRLALGRR